MKKTVLPLVLAAVLWLLATCLCAFTGSIHPACFAYSGTFAPILFAFIYLFACSKRQGFGVPTVILGILLVLFLIAGEIDTIGAIMYVAIIALAEILRKVYGYDNKKGTRISFLPMAFSFYVYVSHWWTDTAGSLQAGVEEMPAGYADKMAVVIDNTTMLVVMLVLTIPVAILAMRLAEKVLKK
ncbi:MAG: MptD family putative ECF transporter S component [Bacteroidales bacterium]|nr:MptD family putative ECF transporter S component [Bacteroidales bacterium]